MTDGPGDIMWLTDSDGIRFGAVDTEEGLRLIFPDGTTRLITAEDAPRVINMLRDGITFTQITGTETFAVSPDDF